MKQALKDWQNKDNWINNKGRTRKACAHRQPPELVKSSVVFNGRRSALAKPEIRRWRRFRRSSQLALRRCSTAPILRTAERPSPRLAADCVGACTPLRTRPRAHALGRTRLNRCVHAPARAHTHERTQPPTGAGEYTPSGASWQRRSHPRRVGSGGERRHHHAGRHDASP
jgi:hypothetical protein